MRVSIEIKVEKDVFSSEFDVSDSAYTLVKNDPVAFARFIGPQLPMSFAKKGTTVEVKEKEVAAPFVSKPAKPKYTKGILGTADASLEMAQERSITKEE